MRVLKLRNQGMGRLGMGATCQPGYSDILGIGECTPDLSTILSSAEAGVVGSVGTGVANSAATQAAVSTAAANAFGTSIMNFYKNNTVVAVGVTLAVGGILIYGAMSFLRGK